MNYYQNPTEWNSQENSNKKRSSSTIHNNTNKGKSLYVFYHKPYVMRRRLH